MFNIIMACLLGFLIFFLLPAVMTAGYLETECKWSQSDAIVGGCCWPIFIVRWLLLHLAEMLVYVSIDVPEIIMNIIIDGTKRWK